MMQKTLQLICFSLIILHYHRLYSELALVQQNFMTKLNERITQPFDLFTDLQKNNLNSSNVTFSEISDSLIYDQSSIESKLKQISENEKLFLRTMFNTFLQHNCLGHVLFYTTKPACISAINKIAHQKSQKLVLKGWKCWKHYEHLFQHPNFLFVEEEFPIEDEIMLHIFIINKKTLLSSLYNHIAFFKEILGSDFCPENFIKDIETKKTLRPLINNDEALLGLILGYGPESSLAFKKETAHIKLEDWVPPKWYTGVAAKRPKKCKIFPVEFVGNPKSKEVRSLLDHYSNELDGIWQIFKSANDPLIPILEKLCTCTE